MSGVEKLWRRLTKVAHINCGLWSVELVEHGFFGCPLAQQGWQYVAKIMWQLFAQRGNLVLQKSFSMMQ
jgi:hypothetical protein